MPVLFMSLDAVPSVAGTHKAEKEPSGPQPVEAIIGTSGIR
jgi:hypothetical protein